MPGISVSLLAQAALDRMGFKFTRSLGQNFLFDDSILESIASYAGANEKVNVLEIGPGAGVLTATMAEKGANVLSIELDRALEPVLQSTVGNYPNVHIIYADAMRIDLDALVAEYFHGEDYIIAANLPYYITADFITKAVTLPRPPKTITLMVQKEAADRLLAACGQENWCALAAVIEFYCTGERLMEVGRERFTPPPHVDSALIRLTLRKQRIVPEEDTRPFEAFIKSAFAMRRKTLANNLTHTGYGKEEVGTALVSCGLDPRVRGEALTLTQLKSVFYALKGAK